MDDAKRLLFRSGPTVAPGALTALRLGVGVVMMVHGWTKLADVPSWIATVDSIGIAAPKVSAWLAIGGELLGGAGLFVGLVTPIAAFGVLCTMLTAVFAVHWDNGLLAANNGFEYPLVLALVAAYFMIRGAGPYSLDALIARRRASGSAPQTQPSLPMRTAMTSR